MLPPTQSFILSLSVKMLSVGLCHRSNGSIAKEHDTYSKSAGGLGYAGDAGLRHKLRLTLDSHATYQVPGWQEVRQSWGAERKPLWGGFSLR